MSISYLKYLVEMLAMIFRGNWFVNNFYSKLRKLTHFETP